MKIGPRVVPLLLGWCGFLLATAIAGQIILHNQGDTPAASFRYGLLYVVSFAGLPGAIQGHRPFLIAAVCQFLAAGGIYWLARCRVRSAVILLGIVVVFVCVWLIAMAPQIFD